MGNVLLWVVQLAGVVIWAVGFWQLTTDAHAIEAVLALIGGVVFVGAWTWRKRTPGTGLSGASDTLLEFFTRGP